MLGGDEILGLVTHGGGGIGLCRITTRLVGLLDHVGLVESRVQIGGVDIRFVFDTHEGRRKMRRFPILGDHQRDRLAVELDVVVIERAKR